MSTATPVADIATPTIKIDESGPERLYPLSVLAARGYGSRHTLRERIKNGEIPGLRVGNVFKIRERDLPLLVAPTGGEA